MQQEIIKVPLTLKVNGKEHQLLVKPRQTLLAVLRDELGLTGTKLGCDDGACGTCTVTVNGVAARACRVPVEHVKGKDILTIEGLGTSERLHPLQEAFIEADAVQCGFCTPGTIMAAKALLDRNPAPTREEIAKALKNNLCRCTGYVSTDGLMRETRCSELRSMPRISLCPAWSMEQFFAALILMPTFFKSMIARPAPCQVWWPW